MVGLAAPLVLPHPRTSLKCVTPNLFMSTFVSKTARLRHALFLFVLFVVVVGATWLVVVVSISTAPTAIDFQVGDVSTQEILAPFAISYTSEVLTERRRETAANLVSPRYTVPDTSQARQQLDQLRAALAYIDSVRSDSYASFEQ